MTGRNPDHPVKNLFVERWSPRAFDGSDMERRQAESFRNLDRGHFIALGPALSRRPVPVKIGPVETMGRGGSPKLMPLPEQPRGEAKDLIFTPAEGETPPVRQRYVEPVASTGEVLDQLTNAGQVNVESAPEAENLLDFGEREEKIAEIIAGILEDEDAAFQPIATLYQDFQVRCRIAKLAGGAPDLQTFREKLSVARAGVDKGEMDDGAWSQAELIAAELPEDMKADFPTERWFWFDPPFNKDQSALLHKQPDGVWRIDLQLGWDIDKEKEKKPENVIPRLKQMLGEEVEFDLEWVSIYTFQCRRMKIDT